MDDFRSRSYADGRNNMQIEVYGRGPMPPLRSYSTNNTTSYSYEYDFDGDHHTVTNNKKRNNKTSKEKKGWGLVASDAEVQRKRRVAGYRKYEVEGKLKGSIKNSFRWLKNRYDHIIYGSYS